MHRVDHFLNDPGGDRRAGCKSYGIDVSKGGKIQLRCVFNELYFLAVLAADFIQMTTVGAVHGA